MKMRGRLLRLDNQSSVDVLSIDPVPESSGDGAMVVLGVVSLGYSDLPSPERREFSLSHESGGRITFSGIARFSHQDGNQLFLYSVTDPELHV